MKKEIDVYKFIDSLNLSEKEKLELASRIMLYLTWDTEKQEYNDIYESIEKIK
jgi:hypothetical protein